MNEIFKKYDVIETRGKSLGIEKQEEIRKYYHYVIAIIS